MQLKKYEYFVENVRISCNFKEQMKRDIRKAKQKYSKTNCITYNHSETISTYRPGIQCLEPNKKSQQEQEIQAFCSSFTTNQLDCTEKSIYTPHPQVKHENISDLKSKYEHINFKQEISILIFQKHIKICKKMIEMKSLAEAEVVILAIQKTLEQVLLPQADLRWKILRIKATIVRTEIIFSKLSLQDIYNPQIKDRQNMLNKKQICFLQRLPLFCKQIQKEAYFSFLERDFYAFIEVLYFVSAKSLMLDFSSKYHSSKITKKRKANILSSIEKGKTCLAKQLDDLCIKLVNTKEKKILDIITHKSESLLNFFGLELTVNVVTQIFENLSVDERKKFKLKLKGIFQQDVLEQQQNGKQSSPKEIDDLKAKMLALKTKIWESYEKIVRKIPNYVETRPLELILQNALLNSIEQINTQEPQLKNCVTTRTQNFEGTKSRISRMTRSPQNKQQNDQHNDISQLQKGTKFSLDSKNDKSRQEESDDFSRTLADQTIIQISSNNFQTKWLDEQKIAYSNLVVQDAINSQSTISLKKKDAQSLNLLSPYVIKINNQGQSKTKSESRSYSNVNQHQLAKDNFKIDATESQQYKRERLKPRPSILAQTRYGRDSSLELSVLRGIGELLLGKQMRRKLTITQPAKENMPVNVVSTSQTHLMPKTSLHYASKQAQKNDIEATQKRAVSTKNEHSIKKGPKSYNLHIFRLAKSASKLTISKPKDDKKVFTTNFSEISNKALRSSSWGIEKLNPFDLTKRKNELVILPFLAKLPVRTTS